MSNTVLRIGWDLHFSNRNFLALSMQEHGYIMQHRRAHAALFAIYANARRYTPKSSTHAGFFNIGATLF